MPRKPRIELAGKYHIINRGVAQMHIFREPADYEYFEELMCHYAKQHNITIHNYCLMSNHYHLLIEIKTQNLSKFMRQLNMNYAIYYNKKRKRTGHLWQGCPRRSIWTPRRSDVDSSLVADILIGIIAQVSTYLFLRHYFSH